MALTERDIEVLGDLEAAVRNYQNVGIGSYVRPLDCGGGNGSDHSYRLSKLARLGYAKDKQRGLPEGKKLARGYRGSKEYTITEEGLAVVAEARSKRRAQ